MGGGIPLVALLALVAMPRSVPIALQSTCLPCTSGTGCSAGCRSGVELPLKLARTQELTLQAPARRRAMHMRAHHSLREQDEAMKHINKKLLRLSTHEGKGELGSVLNSAMGEVLRAEEAEVQLRRLAALQKESSINTAVDHLGSSDQQLFKLRATEFELALKQADKEMAQAAKTMAPMADMDEVQRRGRAAAPAPDGVKPSWTSQMSNMISSVVSDGHGAAWGYGKKAAMAKTLAKHNLPGVVEDNWSLNRGALAIKPKSTGDRELPGVKTHGW